MGVALQNKESAQKIEVIETTNNQIGPAPVEAKNDNDQGSRNVEPAIAIMLPDITDIIPISLSLMRNLSKAGIVPRIYTGAGLGAAMAVAMAFNLSADEIEWELFALEREGAHELIDKAKALVSRYEKNDLSQSFHVLVLPTVKGKWITRGKVENVMQAHLASVGQNKWPIRVPKGNFGADIVIKVDNANVDEYVLNLKEQIARWKEKKK